VLTIVIKDRADWLAKDMDDPSEWAIQLSPAQVNAIDAALCHAKQNGATLPTLTKENFPLELFEDTVADVLYRLEEGRGLAVLRGFPALKYSKEDLRMIYWGMGQYFGTGLSQSSKGDLLGDVRDFGQLPTSSTGRGYMSKVHLGFHSDSADWVCLMVLRTAKEGGLSKICSVLAIRNEIARTRPDLLEVLYEPFYWSWKGQEAPGDKPYYKQPIFSEHNGRFSCRYIKTHILNAHEDFPELPPLTDVQLEAMAMIDDLANDPKYHFCMMFEPGDMQFLNNHVTMHSRTGFTDYEEEDRKRHLLRMWIAPPNSRALSPAMGEFYKDLRPGVVRGGFPSRTGSHSFETVPAKD
jgi:hypothetical protein